VKAHIVRSKVVRRAGDFEWGNWEASVTWGMGKKGDLAEKDLHREAADWPVYAHPNGAANTLVSPPQDQNQNETQEKERGRKKLITGRRRSNPT